MKRIWKNPWFSSPSTYCQRCQCSGNFLISGIVYVSTPKSISQTKYSGNVHPFQDWHLCSIHTLVYGGMYKIGLLRILQFNFVGYFASSNPSLPESSCRHFCPFACMAAILNLKWLIYTGIKKSTYSNQVEKHVNLFVWS